MQRQQTDEIAGSRSVDALFDEDDFEFRRNFHRDVVVERDVPGRPHEGKVLLLVMTHADDHSGTGTAGKTDSISVGKGG